MEQWKKPHKCEDDDDLSVANSGKGENLKERPNELKCFLHEHDNS